MFPQTLPGAATALPPAIDTRLRHIALRYRETTDPEDLYQEMALTLLDTAHKDPTFFEQNTSYISSKASFRAIDLIRRDKMRTKYILIVPHTPPSRSALNIDDPDEHFGPGSHIDTFASPTANPEDLVLEHIEAVKCLEALKKLSPTNQQIVKMVYLGYSQAQIAQHLGISEPAVSQQRKTIARRCRESLGVKVWEE